ncbi:D-2-hydroxyacid dehydrogenase [Rhodoplanes sp. TEM]|uniref:D-2-hydroxyacid dehydrogenase n=1 Tax=Rhodoplanes tepidamans TaxID=200616 RepID=A0ABT5J936_RHOTP|nr:MULTISPECIES: D-2-hydroxyacid dehydrogenase [Rhodoplanes]MDC7786003.1 D-2-hydroxyacid dehydrogenase [Rhodoplanes tepidamans]MDC7984901.1 D-2-hydroxyacid dehydrogenase [Rhodoplanes sp. TEM]MDQ0357030.1 phosphoglycerate dehydrogenase-like enzyme [Rhodoplanes tepidamans]
MRIALHVPFGAEAFVAALREIPGAAPVVATTKEELSAALASADALAVMASLYDQETADAVAAAPRLRWIHFVSSGVDPLLRFPPPAGVAITNSAAAWAPTVAEHAVTLLSALLRQLPAAVAAQRERRWAAADLRPRLRSLEASTIVLLGFGAIGQAIARRLKAFDAHVIAVARTRRSHADVDEFATVEALDEVLPRADALVAVLPSTPATRGLLDAERLARLPRGALVVNVGRGDTIVQDALIAALADGGLGGAALDVFEREPVPADSPVWTAPNLIVTPHLAGIGSRALAGRLAAVCADNARRAVKGRPFATPVETSTLGG